ncbi:MAG: (S)-benzoin forming benzil reductase [Lentimicrobiaceae bacterium]|jgi:benzil reductase ((S)-benzoin forming)|nr:(S)-benzoin forming benzil reductase [Lentimicrobiaceae bacterium]MDD4598044.1 (S)-benzoin forming benzil reductase [Lentimicrobiaceae bacterium]MDY0025196.1 (S)-benzoin forming benzil reductase [Lentimicrobium sp.]
MKYYIVTGTSSGIGEALALRLINEKQKVFCISRRMNAKLTKMAASQHAGLWYYQLNLANGQGIAHIMREIFTFIDPEIASGVALINNAGVVSPVAPSGKLDIRSLENHIKVNLTAPMILANEFISRASSLKVEKTIVNISSGAAQNPYSGWSAYCSSKAGLNMLTKVIALEQQSEKWPVRIFSVAPGVVNTSMQKNLRQTSAEDFPQLDKFIHLYKSKQLSEPDAVAKKLIELTFGNDPASGEIIDLRTF